MSDVKGRLFSRNVTHIMYSVDYEKMRLRNMLLSKVFDQSY